MTQQNIIVVGASAGGIEVLEDLIGALPADMHAAVLIVLHRPPDQPSLLPLILQRAGPLPIADASDGDTIQHGHIYIAPPDRHLLVENGVLHLIRGPKENHSRPAIDPLFRSAAQQFGAHVAGVILSGTLFDGTAGLFAVKRHGGVTIVQDPREAAFPGMPESAIGNVDVDYVLPVNEIAALLVRLAGKPSELTEARDKVSRAMSIEPAEFERLPAIVRENQDQQIRGERHGHTSTFTCPDCGGTLWQADDGTLTQFRCHVGHIYTADSMVREQIEALERSLWYSIRTFKDHSLLLRELAESARRRGDTASVQRLITDSENAMHHSNALRHIVEGDLV